MLVLHRKEAAPYYSRALCSVLTARRQFEESMHITSDIEKTADEIVKHGQPLDSLNAVLDLVESMSDPSSSSSSTSATPHEGLSPPSSPVSSPMEPSVSPGRTIVLSLSVLGSLLGVAQAKSTPVSASQTQRLGQIAVKFLQDTDSDVRKADLDFCLVLHERLGGENGEGFWKVVQNVGVKDMHLNLITYYLARRGRAVV